MSPGFIYCPKTYLKHILSQCLLTSYIIAWGGEFNLGRKEKPRIKVHAYLWFAEMYWMTPKVSFFVMYWATNHFSALLHLALAVVFF